MDIHVNGQKVRTSIRISSPGGHLLGYSLGYPGGCPCRIICATDSSTRDFLFALLSPFVLFMKCIPPKAPHRVSFKQLLG